MGSSWRVLGGLMAYCTNLSPVVNFWPAGKIVDRLPMSRCSLSVWSSDSCLEGLEPVAI